MQQAKQKLFRQLPRKEKPREKRDVPCLPLVGIERREKRVNKILRLLDLKYRCESKNPKRKKTKTS